MAPPFVALAALGAAFLGAAFVALAAFFGRRLLDRGLRRLLRRRLGCRRLLDCHRNHLVAKHVRPSSTSSHRAVPAPIHTKSFNQWKRKIGKKPGFSRVFFRFRASSRALIKFNRNSCIILTLTYVNASVIDKSASSPVFSGVCREPTMRESSLARPPTVLMVSLRARSRRDFCFRAIISRNAPPRKVRGRSWTRLARWVFEHGGQPWPRDNQRVSRHASASAVVGVARRARSRDSIPHRARRLTTPRARGATTRRRAAST